MSTLLVKFFTHHGTAFVWEAGKAESNARKHEVAFEEAATAFGSPRGAPRRPKKASMLNERLKKRLRKDRPSTTITMRSPIDVVESLKAVAPARGFTGYQTLLKSYISDGLHRDEAALDQENVEKLVQALKRRGVADRVLKEALKELGQSDRARRS